MGTVYDDIFRSTIPVAEEAIVADDAARDSRESDRFLSRNINVFEVQLRDLCTFVNAAGGDELSVRGYSTR